MSMIPREAKAGRSPSVVVSLLSLTPAGRKIRLRHGRTCCRADEKDRNPMNLFVALSSAYSVLKMILFTSNRFSERMEVFPQYLLRADKFQSHQCLRRWRCLPCHEKQWLKNYINTLKAPTPPSQAGSPQVPWPSFPDKPLPLQALTLTRYPWRNLKIPRRSSNDTPSAIGEINCAPNTLYKYAFPLRYHREAETRKTAKRLCF